MGLILLIMNLILIIGLIFITYGLTKNYMETNSQSVKSSIKQNIMETPIGTLSNDIWYPYIDNNEITGDPLYINN